ncbi:MFS transporter [Sphingomonas sp.]|uniref:MFS transporter n=1 Tax=Sphingomonas sp. TaxID=28214 RepID=UPI001B02E964|nr:MFS transporter [Sphingomonas sp.]MBO9711852.1 MHS family MFS transporter [Sphingomonas sp.]
MTGTNPASHRRILFASLTGTSVEFYDFYIYGTAAALVFPDLFFPAADPALRLLASYGSFSIAFFARPLGGLAFGHFGDRLGRKSTLVASLMLMGISTVLIGLLPGYAMAGVMAPLLLSLLRFGQGFGLGGEWGGASLLAVENAPPGKAYWYGSFPPLGAPVGFIAANGLFLILGASMSDQAFHDWGWRIPFLLSAVLVGFGLWVRLSITETPEFKEALAKEPPPKVPMGELLSGHLKPTLAGIAGAVACFALFYITTVWMMGYGAKVLKYDRETLLAVELGAILFMAAGILVAGKLADRTSGGTMLGWGFAALIATGLAMPAFVDSGSLALLFAWLAMGLFVMGFVYGPIGGWLPSLFPARVRYTGVSVTFNVAGIIGGGLTPYIAEILVREGGISAVGYYLVAAGVLSALGLTLAKAKRAAA